MSENIRQEYEELVARSEWITAAELDGASTGYWELQEDWNALNEGRCVAAIRYWTSGIEMVTYDWQASQPDMTDAEDIADWEWVDVDGFQVTMVDGMPVRFFA